MASPIIGSALYEAVGFESSMDLEAAVFLVNSIVYSLYTLSDLRKEKRLQNSQEAIEPHIEESEVAPFVRRSH